MGLIEFEDGDLPQGVTITPEPFWEELRKLESRANSCGSSFVDQLHMALKKLEAGERPDRGGVCPNLYRLLHAVDRKMFPVRGSLTFLTLGEETGLVGRVSELVGLLFNGDCYPINEHQADYYWCFDLRLLWVGDQLVLREKLIKTLINITEKAQRELKVKGHHSGYGWVGPKLEKVNAGI